MHTFLTRSIRYTAYILIAAFPLMYIPFIVDALELGKQSLLLLSVAWLALCWAGFMLMQKKLFLKKTWVFIPAVLFLISACVSAAFSSVPAMSWLGQSALEYGSVATTLAFVLFFFIGSHILHETHTQSILWALMLTCSAIIGLHIVLAIVGITIFSTNFIGTPITLGMYLIILSLLGLSLLVLDGKGKKSIFLNGKQGIVTKISLVLTVLTSFIVVFILDVPILWGMNMVGVGAMMMILLWKPNNISSWKRFFVPMLIFVLSVMGLLIDTPGQNPFATEVTPSVHTSIQIVQQSWEDFGWIFGAGQGSFVIDYALFQPEALVTGDFWDVRFDRAKNYIIGLAHAQGIVGLLAFLAIVFSIAVVTWRNLRDQTVDHEWDMTFIAAIPWTVTVLSLFLYPANGTILFLFWVFSTILVAQSGREIRVYRFGHNASASLAVSASLLAAIVLSLSVIFIGGSRLLADKSFARAVHASAEEDIDATLTYALRAAERNAYSDTYYRALAQALLLKTGVLLQEDAVQEEALRETVLAAIESAQQATQISPKYVLNWSVLGDVYREVAPIANDAYPLAIAAYEQASELAPQNPKYLTSLGRAYIAYADSVEIYIDSEDADIAQSAATQYAMLLETGIETLELAVQKRPTNAQARYYLALAYERKGNITDAIAQMEALFRENPEDIGVSFQLGLLQLKQGQLEKAKDILSWTISIAPNYSNAYWYLASVYEEEGDFDTALELIQVIQNLDPENTFVQQRIDRLEAGIAAAQLPEPLDETEGDGIEETEDTVGL